MEGLGWGKRGESDEGGRERDNPSFGVVGAVFMTSPLSGSRVSMGRSVWVGQPLRRAEPRSGQKGPPKGDGDAIPVPGAISVEIDRRRTWVSRCQ
jgi:hypothetical protein